MEPLPEQVLADARQVLDDVIRPALPEGFAREQAGLLSSLLEHVRLRLTLEHEGLVEDCRDMRAVLDSERVSGIPITASVGIEQLRAESRALRLVLAEVVDELEGADEGGTELLRIRALLRRQLDRDRRLIGPGYPKGT